MAEIPGSGNGEADRDADRQKEAEAFYGQSREEDFAKRDRVLNRLMSAEKVQDVAAALEMVKDYEGVHFGETIDRFTYSAYKKAALEGQRAFEKGSKDLKELENKGIIVGKINSDGFLEKGGKVRAAGYAIRVDRNEVDVPEIVQKINYNVDPKTGERGVPQVVEERVAGKKLVENIYFGIANERLALSRAHEELHKILVTAEILQNQTSLFDETRASLETMVKIFYQKQIYFTNLQTKWFFTAADIGKMDYANPESLYNTELGDRRNKAMRLNYLVGMSEQKERLEKHLNETYNLEEILDYDKDGAETIDKVLKIAKVEGLEDKDEKYKAAVKFLIGKDTEITKDGSGHWKYELKGWLSADERDPLSTVSRAGFRKGEKAVGDETEAKLRGYLAEFGNPYVEGSRDNLYALMGRMNEIVGDEMAVNEAGRFFWTRGERDELGLEVYANEKNLPTGEQLLDKYNELTAKDFGEWEKYCAKIRKCYAISGEPVSSDLSKIFWPKFWRLKEMMFDRSAGPYLTYDKFDRLTQSLLGLCRVRNEAGEVRSIREAWLGYKGGGANPDEKAIDLGDIEWEQVRVPKEIKEGIGAEATDVDAKAIPDNADGYFWVMNYLAGDDNQAKRPWQFIMKGPERLEDLQKPTAYTDMIKFWKIVWHPGAIAWGKWRERYQINKSQGGDYQATTEVGVDNEATQILNKGKKDWYDGIRSLPEYPLMMSQKIQYLKYTENGLVAGSADLVNVIEGQDQKHPGFAVKYGFMDAGKINRPPQYQMSTFK